LAAYVTVTLPFWPVKFGPLQTQRLSAGQPWRLADSDPPEELVCVAWMLPFDAGGESAAAIRAATLAVRGTEFLQSSARSPSVEVVPVLVEL
jgi:hypothetical protein